MTTMTGLRKKRNSYYGVRKEEYDQLWHALYRTDDGKETYDRITFDQAIRIVKELNKN